MVGTFMKINAHALRAHKRSVWFSAVFTSGTNFIFVHHSATKNCLLRKNRIYFQDKVDKANRIYVQLTIPLTISECVLCRFSHMHIQLFLYK
jgi:hypothetical protein